MGYEGRQPLVVASTCARCGAAQPWNGMRGHSPCKPEDSTRRGVRVKGHVGSHICNVLELHHKRSCNKGGIRQAAKKAKILV